MRIFFAPALSVLLLSLVMASTTVGCAEDVFESDSSVSDLGHFRELPDRETSCQDDFLYPNQTIDKAVQLPNSQFHVYSDLVLCGSSDMFVLNLEVGGALFIEAIGHDPQQSLNISVVGPTRLATVAASTPGSDFVQLDFTAEVAGEYLLTISSTPDDIVNYDLVVASIVGFDESGCFEPDDTTWLDPRTNQYDCEQVIDFIFEEEIVLEQNLTTHRR